MFARTGRWHSVDGQTLCLTAKATKPDPARDGAAAGRDERQPFAAAAYVLWRIDAK